MSALSLSSYKAADESDNLGHYTGCPLLSRFGVAHDRRAPWVFYWFLDQDGHLICTVMALYSLGATIILGVGQSNFCLMAKNIGRKLQTLKCHIP